jgi:hypothetical protein
MSVAPTTAVIDDSTFDGNKLYALEVQKPFSEYIATGIKTIETRSYPLPSRLIGKTIFLCESVGAEAQSFLGDDIEAGQLNVSIIGEASFGSCFEYTCREHWDEDTTKHMVPSGSKYDWASGESGRRWGWVVEGCRKYENPTPVPKMTRVFRSIFSYDS